MNVGGYGLIVEGTVNPPPVSRSGKSVTSGAHMHSASPSCAAIGRLGVTCASSASGARARSLSGLKLRASLVDPAEARRGSVRRRVREIRPTASTFGGALFSLRTP